MNWLRSPIQGLGWWDRAIPCSRGRLSASFARWYSYSQRLVRASVAGVNSAKPLGSPASGSVLPRE